MKLTEKGKARKPEYESDYDQDSDQYQEEYDNRKREHQRAFLSPMDDEDAGNDKEHLPRFDVQRISVSDAELNYWYNDRRDRSFRSVHHGHKVYVKRDTITTYVKVQSANKHSCKSAWIWEPRDGWFMVEDRMPIEHVTDVSLPEGSSGEPGVRDVIVIVHKSFW